MKVTAADLRIKIDPLVGLRAYQSPKAGRAWAIFMLAKGLAFRKDHISIDKLKSVVLELGVEDRSFRRWVYQAVTLGMMKFVTRKSGEKVLVLKNYKAVSKQFGQDKKEVIYVDGRKLFGKNGKAYVFAVWQARFTHSGRILTSQKRQAELTGISEQTQRKYNKKAGVKSTKNFAISNVHANGMDDVKEHRPRACAFSFWNYETHQWHLGWRLPDTRVFSEFATNGPVKSPRTTSLFNYTSEQHLESIDLFRRASSEGRVTVGELYVFDRTSSRGNGLWIHNMLHS